MRVRVYRPAKSASQSGYALAHQWVIEAENATPRVPEHIMGWSSARDTFSCLRGRLRFPSQDDAIAFAKGNGWSVIMNEPQERTFRPRTYAQNFRIQRPQDEERTAYTK
ncbi:MAG: NADH dehydrogenase ubiquinone Fe-S protein 4 [Bdellovibrionales bacterium]